MREAADAELGIGHPATDLAISLPTVQLFLSSPAHGLPRVHDLRTGRHGCEGAAYGSLRCGWFLLAPARWLACAAGAWPWRHQMTYVN